MPRIHLPLYGQLKGHVSFSELRLFNECPWKWALTKVYGLSSFDRSFQMDFGKAAHSGMEVLYDPGTPLDPVLAAAHAMALYDKSLAELEELGMHPSDRLEAHRIRDFLPRFYQDCLVCPELQGIKTLRSELRLMEDIERNDGLTLKFKGFIDITFVRQLKRKTVIYIADFKTCQWGWPAKKLQDIEVISQILLYKHFFCKMTGADPGNVSVAFILLRKLPRDGGLTVSVERISAGPKSTERALTYLQDTITRMHTYSYEQRFDSCKRSWKDRETGEERIASCQFIGTEHCNASGGVPVA
jgi:hypothetical protein